MHRCEECNVPCAIRYPHDGRFLCLVCHERALEAEAYHRGHTIKREGGFYVVKFGFRVKAESADEAREIAKRNLYPEGNRASIDECEITIEGVDYSEWDAPRVKKPKPTPPARYVKKPKPNPPAR